MVQRVFIKVIGFSDEERHALNTLFRLSEQCLTMYQLWTPQASEPPGALLLDGQSWEARVEGASPSLGDMRLLWFGPYAPPAAWRSFERPIHWPEVIAALDLLFTGAEAVDLDLAALDTPAASAKQALIVAADRDRRLYLRARLAIARLVLADDAETGLRAVELARDKQYDVAFVDMALPDLDPWALVRALRQGQRPVPKVAVTGASNSVGGRLRAWSRGADLLLEHPPHPGRLGSWLKRV